MSNPSPFPDRQPWPMRWVALIIVVTLGGYTALTLLTRKPGRAHEPYHELKERANTGRLLAAGYQRVELEIHRTAETGAIANHTLPAPGGLPEPLRATLIDAPMLPADVLAVSAAPVADADQPYSVLFRCAVRDDAQQLAAVVLYVQGDGIVIVPHFERLSGGLQSRSREANATATVPGGSLKPGRYRVSLLGSQTSRAWTLDVR